MGACLSCKNEQGSRHEKTYTTLSFRRKRKKLVSDLDSKEEDVAAFRQLGGRIAPRVSPHDRNLVDYQVRDIEGRYNDLRQRSKHQKQACEVVIISRETLLKDLDGYVAWLKERKKMVGSQLSLGHGVQNVQQQLHEHNIICKEIESKHTVLESVSRQRETLLSELSHPERESVDKQIQSVQKEHSQLHNNALTKQKLLSRSLELREEFYQSYEKITIWVVEKERIVGKIDTIRLYAVEVERQHEKYKTLLTEVTSMEGTLEEVVTQGRNLQTDCDEQGTSELETMLKELLERYQTMKTRLSEHVKTLRMSLTVRRKYESNIQRLELWLKEVELTITTEIRLDCTIELIEEQLKKYQSLLQKIAEYEVLSDEVTSQGQSFLGSLSEADKLTLQAQIKTLRDRHQRISNLAKQRVKTLEDTVYARGQLDDEISQCARILNSLQEDVRRLNKPLAIKAVEVQKMLAQCEKLQTQLNDYQPTIIALNQSKDSMAAKGQTTEASELSRLTMTFDQVMMQVEQSYARLENAVTIRQHYESLKTEFETCLKESQEQLDAVSELGIPTPTKFDRYKAVHTILEEQELQLATIMDKGQQIAIECNTTDQRTVADQNQSLKQKFDKLLRAVEKKTEELDKIMSDRRDFETEMDKTLEWLQSKNREIVVQVPLSMEADEVEVEIKKHKVVADEINSHLREVQTKIAQQRAHFEELDEIMPIEMTDRLEQYENDRAALQSKLYGKSDYLNAAKNNRLRFDDKQTTLTIWLQDAEKLLVPVYDGIDYESITFQLQQHREYFADGHTRTDEMSRIQDTAERLFPTLDPNDKETLQQSVEALNQKLTDVLKAAAKRQKQLEDELKNWNEFQGQLEDASQTVKELELKWENVDTTAAATSEQAAKQLVQIENFTEAVQKRAAVVDQMNQKARELTRSGNQNSQTVITRMIAGINERWRTVSSQADERQIVLREYVTEWHLFYQIYERFEHFLITIEERMPKEDAIKLTTAQLQVQMSDCQTIKTELEKQHSEIGKMQKAAQAILSKLPSSDARIAVQRKMVAAQDRYDKLHKEATDIQQTALGEVQTRDTFLQELHLTLQWLQEAQARSQSLTQGDLHTRTEKYKALQREVILKTEHLKTLVHKQREKYRALSRDLPPELITEIEVYKQAEEATVKQLKESEKQLDHAKQSKIEYHDMVKTVNTWLTNAEEKVQDKDGDLEETNQKHQQLCVEIELFKTQPEQLESKASEVINLTDDPKERSSITKTVNSVNDRWARLLQKAAERTEHLQEALDLWDSFESSHIVVSSQLTRTETVVCTELAWASLERVKQQLQEHRALLENAPEIDSKLEAMSSTVRQLSDICNARSVSNKLSDLQDQWFTVKTQVSERTAILEETVGEWEQYEKEMADIGKWMEETKHSMHLKDTTLSLKEQLAAQERLLSDIKKHGSKANTILARHEELRCMAGDFSPTRGAQLSTEIARLQNEAKDQYEKLVSAIAQQEKYEAEISRLTLLITEAQQKLTTSPVVASSVEGLKKQIAEHNTLTAQIKTYQEKIREINEQSLQLQERTQQMSPTIRKKFNWGSERSLASDETGLMSSLSSESIATRKTSQGQPPGDWKEHRTDSGIMMTPEGSISSKETQRRGADSLRPGDAGGTALREMVESAMHGRSNTPSGGWSASSAETVLERRAPDRESSGKGKSQEMEPPEKIPKIREVDEDVPDAAKPGKKSDRQKSKHVTDNSDQMSIKSDDTDNLLEEYSNAMAARDMTDGTVKDPEAGEEPEPSDSLRKMVESAMRDRKSPVQEQLVTEIEGARAMEVEEAEIFPQKKPIRAQVDTEIRESPNKENLEQLLSPERVLTVPEDTESLSDQASVSSDLMATLGSPVKPADLTVSTLGDTTGDVSMSASGPGSPNKMAQLAELNSSWNTLQVQLGVKEQQLQEALHKQEQYQDALQDVTSNIEQVRLQVDALSPETTEDLESMVTQCQVLMTHIEEIKTKLAGVRSLGQQMSSSSEPEGPRVMQATLVVLTDRLESLQSMTRTRMRQTEMKLHDQQKHQADLQEYQTNIEEFDEWLTTARLENSDEAMTDPDTATLKQQLEKNKNLQAEVNKRLQQLSDMAVQCESLMELGSSEGATGLRSRVSELKAQVTEFKLQIIDGQRQIKDKIRDVERQALSAEEESSMQELQQWMENTRRMTLSPKKDETGPKLVEENYQLQQQLETDLAKHQRLIRSVSTSGVNYVEPKDAPFEARADVVQANWDRLAKMAADKKQQAEEVINRARSEGKPLAIYQKGQRSVHEPGTTTKTEEVKIGMLELTQCWERLQRPDQDDETRSERLLQFQRQFQETILTLSEWMDLIEVKLFAVDHDRTAEEQLKENESVMKELRSVQEDVKELGRTSHHILPEVGEEEKQMVKVTMENMGKRLQVLERRGYDQEQELMEKTRKWKHYQTEVKSLQSKLTETRRHFITSAQSVAPLEQQLAEIKKLEDSIKQYEQKLHKLSQEGEELSEGDPRAILPVEMNTLHTSWQQLQQQATERKAQLQRAMTVQSQYEKMIQEYAEFLDTAQDKLRADTLAASDLQHLAQQLKAHKEFFSDLEGHRSMLDALAQKTDKATRQRYFSMHTRLINLTHIVQDKASLRGQRIERIVEEWAQFEDQFNQTNEWLVSLEKQSPVRTTEDETGAIRQHQFVQKRLNDEKAAMYQVVEKGKQLAQRVKCPALETNVATFAERWVAINNATNQELKRLEVLLDQQTTFDHDAGTLEEWLATAKEKAGEFVLKDEDVKDIGAIRSYIDRFLEFRKEVEHQSPLKNKVMLTGNQILRTRKTDSSGLPQRLNSIEESWLQLTTQLTSCEDRLHQAQMELMPSRQALSELLIWISGLEKVLKDDKNIPLDSALDTKIMLTKYRGFKVDISNKQLTVDFVNQSALEMSIRVPHGHQAEKTDFAEKLGQMNRRWQAAASDVAERLKMLEMLQVRWEEYEKCVKGLMEWFDDQENKIKKYHRIGHEISIRQTLKDCKSLEEQLKVKEDEIESVKKLGLSLMESSKGSSDSIHDVKTTVDKLNQHWACLDHQVCQVQNVLEDTLRQWETYQASLQVVSQLLTETEYLLSRYNVVSGDATTFKSQLLRLKGMQKEFDQQGSKLKQFLDDGDQLIKVCEPFVTQGLQRAVTDVKSRWDSLVSQLRTRVSKYEGILEKWQKYEADYTKAKDWVEKKEIQCNELLLLREEAEDKDGHLNKSKELKQELDNFQTSLLTLNKASDQLTKNMDNTTIIGITSRETALSQRVSTMRQALLKHTHNLQNDLSQQRRFDDLIEVIQEFFTDAERVLEEEDPNKSADEDTLKDRLEELKALNVQFNNYQSKLDNLNNMGYRLPLSKKNSEKLKQTNQKWYKMFAETSERYRTMQGHMLLHHDFQQKCDAWMTFLAQAEQNLAVDIAGNYEGLLEQQKIYELFQSEIYSRQQILQSIISDGHQMMRDSDSDERQEFQRKLSMLDQQWQSVVRRTNQRKAIIDHNISHWQMYKTLREKLSNWLDEMDENLNIFEFSTATLQKIKALIEHLRATQKDLAMHESMYQRVHEAGCLLVSISDKTTESTIRSHLTDIQQHWFQIIGKLDGRREHLEGILKQWQGCEEGIEDILAWLKEMRKALNVGLAQNYDDLQRQLQQCVEFETAFANAADKRKILLEKEHQLALVVSPDDLTILRQRIVLLTKQWDEIANQIVLRRNCIEDRLNEWTLFNDKYREMLDWLSYMEAKVSSNQEFHIEDILEKLQKDYKEEITNMQVNRDDLFAHGHRLIKSSSEVRANDIEYKISKLRDRWQRLQELVTARLKKLQETLTAVQELEKSMASLRRWLAYIEHALSSPVSYQQADLTEIHRRLQQQQEHQQDIERHSAGVASVLNLCQVLLHDTDACPTDVEVSALQHAKTSLDRRWKNIRALSTERRMRIEETWRLWQKFSEDYHRFVDWMKDMEKATTKPRSASVTFAEAKEELRKFETLQRSLHENLAELELINKQYRRLARESRTDVSSMLKGQVTDANNAWDKLSKRLSGIIRRLKHLLNVHEDFKTTREALLVWLTDLDMQITNMEHFSEMDIDTKLHRMLEFQEQIKTRSSKLQYVDKAAAYLLQKCEPSDTVRIEKELKEFSQYSKEVLLRVKRYQEKLEKISTGNISGLWAQRSVRQEHDYDHDAEVGALLGDSHVHFKDQDIRHDSSSRLRIGTPGSEASLDWDMYDVEKMLDDSPPESPTPLDEERELKWQSIQKQIAAKKGKLGYAEAYLTELEQLIDHTVAQLIDTEQALRCKTPTGPELEESGAMGYAQYLYGSRSNLELIRSMCDSFKQDTGLSAATSVQVQAQGVVQRWELLQAQAQAKDGRLKKSRQQWQQFKTDIRNVILWLDEAEAIQRTQVIVPSDIKQLEVVIRRHREFLLQLDSRKAIVLSINLLSQQFLGQDNKESRNLKEHLLIMNQRWENVTSKTSLWQKKLQMALMQCHDFHQTIKDLLLWLESVEAKIKVCEPVNIHDDKDTLRLKYNKFKEVQTDLERSQPRVTSLKESTDQLLSSSDSSEAKHVREKMIIIDTRLRTLSRQCMLYISKLEVALGIAQRESPLSFSLDLSDSANRGQYRTSTPRYRSRSSNSPLTPTGFSRQLLAIRTEIVKEHAEARAEAETTESPPEGAVAVRRRRPAAFLVRVCRTALPLQILLLLLLGIACLVPMSEEDFMCELRNNFQRSLDPMLTYLDGPPPV